MQWFNVHIDGLVQERRNSSALAMELCLSCINPSIWHTVSNVNTRCFCVYYVVYFQISSISVDLHFSLPSSFSFSSASLLSGMGVTAGVRAGGAGVWPMSVIRDGVAARETEEAPAKYWETEKEET